MIKIIHFEPAKETDNKVNDSKFVLTKKTNIKMNTKLLLTVVPLFGLFLKAQEVQEQPLPEKEKLNVSLELKNNHLWRGLVGADVLFSSVDINYAFDKQNHFILGVWGGSELAGEEHADGKNYAWHEIDYYFKYDTGRFMVGLWDCFSDSGKDRDDLSGDIWNYDTHTTGHRVDFRGYYVLSEQTPLKIEFGTSIYGDDRTLKGDQKYSTYAELNYPLIRDKKTNLNVFCGAGIGYGGNSHMYGNGKHDFDIVNVGITTSRAFTLWEHKVPVSATAMWNPSNKMARVQLAAVIF
ncbi:MAG: hypothetical protein LBP34_03365 [Flavobacteriaceae bacterium]|jgi:hypothetical protein|nr:hypothetical protein [Flavobacteriaceae bacterium]